MLMKVVYELMIHLESEDPMTIVSIEVLLKGHSSLTLTLDYV